jgi:hypothetical protein
MVTDLQKRVIDNRKKKVKRLRRNYQLARAYGYTSEEASLLQNQSHKTLVYNAVKDGRIPQGSDVPTLWDELIDYCNEMHQRHFPGLNTAQDVTNEGGD